MSKYEGSKSYKFTFTGDILTALYEIKGVRVESESIDADETWVRDGTNVLKIELEHGRKEVTTYSDPDGDGYYSKTAKTWLTESGSGDNGASAYRHVEGREESDSDNDAFESHFAGVFSSGSANAPSLTGIRTGRGDSRDQHRFVLQDGTYADGDLVDAGEAVEGHFELGRRGWKQDYLDRDEQIDVQELGNAAFIIKSELERNGSFEFSVFADADGDGVWVEVLEGHAAADYAVNGNVSLVGLVEAGLLDTVLLGP